MRRYCLALDLKADASLIDEYEQWHQRVPSEIEKSMFDSGVLSLEMYRTATRMIMIIEVDDDFSFERKANLDGANTKVQEWEKLMWRFQQPLPGSKPGEKWIVMKRFYHLTKP